MEPTASAPLHIAAVPYPGRGHINPMLSLCRTLLTSSHGILISFIVTEEWANLIAISSSPLPTALRLVTIPNVLPPERTRGADFAVFVRAVQTEMPGPVEAAVAELCRPAVDLVLADSVLAWAPEMGKRMGMPVVALWTESAAVLRALMTFERLDREGQLPADFSDDEILAYIPRVATPHFADLISNTPEHFVLRNFLKRVSWSTTAQSLLLSSSYELESHVIDTLKTDYSVPMYAVGPSIPYMTLDEPSIAAEAESSYIKWLDSKPCSSVLYIALGSFLSASSEQVNEMVAGLNESGVHYLWVSSDKQLQSKELDREIGMVVPWCDQLRVLCHPSVGGFLTHCGWNSTLEGVYAGVPMLTYPLIWDQYPNSKQIVYDWKIGLQLKDEDVERVIGREEVARKVRELMDLEAEASKQMRKRAAKLKELCRQALGEGGSSSTSLDIFVQAFINMKGSIKA